jgi:hypothetical protein
VKTKSNTKQEIDNTNQTKPSPDILYVPQFWPKWNQTPYAIISWLSPMIILLSPFCQYQGQKKRCKTTAALFCPFFVSE